MFLSVEVKLVLCIIFYVKYNNSNKLNYIYIITETSIKVVI